MNSVCVCVCVCVCVYKLDKSSDFYPSSQRKQHSGPALLRIWFYKGREGAGRCLTSMGVHQYESSSFNIPGQWVPFCAQHTDQSGLKRSFLNVGGGGSSKQPARNSFAVTFTAHFFSTMQVSYIFIKFESETRRSHRWEQRKSRLSVYYVVIKWNRFQLTS